jgi:hypothetical protein
MLYSEALQPKTLGPQSTLPQVAVPLVLAQSRRCAVNFRQLEFAVFCSFVPHILAA